MLKAAIEEGVVVGGGCCLLRLSLKVNEIKKLMDNEEQKVIPHMHFHIPSCTDIRLSLFYIFTFYIAVYYCNSCKPYCLFIDILFIIPFNNNESYLRLLFIHTRISLMNDFFKNPSDSTGLYWRCPYSSNKVLVLF